MLDVIGALLPPAAGIALSPFPIVAAILVARGPHAATAVPAFVAGWLLALGAVTAVAVGVGELLGSGEPATWAAWARVVLGAALVGLGVRTLVGRRRGDEPVTTPGWMAGLSGATARRALLLGVALAAANPKVVAMVLPAASTIGQADQRSGSVLLEAAVFVLLASSSVLAVLVVSLVGGERGARALAAVEQPLLRHNDWIVAAVLVVVGASVVGTGLTGLG